MPPSTDGARERAAIYARISRDRAGAGLGVGRQEKDCQEVADRLGWAIAEGVGWTVQKAPRGGKPRTDGVYDDNDISAYSGKPRPGYRRLLEDLRAGKIDGVLCWHTDRLHRSPVELEEYIAACEPRGVPTQTVKAGPLDLATPSGRMVARTLGNIARYEVEHMIERQKAAKRQAAEDGHYRGGPRPYGYLPDGMTLVEEEAAVIRWAYAQVLAGVSLRRIAMNMNAAGHFTPREASRGGGNPWRHNTLRVMLLRARNAGLIEHHGRVVGPAKWPAIVDEATWRAVKAILTDESRRTGPGPARRWLLSGLIRCGVCQGTVRIKRVGGKYVSYVCEDRGCVGRNAQAVDGLITDVVIERLSRPDATDLLEGGGTDLAELETRRGALRARLDQLGTAFAADQIDGLQLAAGSKPLRAQMAEIERQIGDARRGSVLEAIAGAPNPAKVWAKLDLDQQRAIIGELLTIEILPVRKGQRGPGWKPGQSWFDPSSVRITPKHG